MKEFVKRKDQINQIGRKLRQISRYFLLRLQSASINDQLTMHKQSTISSLKKRKAKIT